ARFLHCQETGWMIVSSCQSTGQSISLGAWNTTETFLNRREGWAIWRTLSIWARSVDRGFPNGPGSRDPLRPGPDPPVPGPRGRPGRPRPARGPWRPPPRSPGGSAWPRYRPTGPIGLDGHLHRTVKIHCVLVSSPRTGKYRFDENDE